MEKAVQHAIYFEGKSVGREFKAEDRKRFVSYLLNPPRTLSLHEFHNSDIRFYKSKAEEVNTPSPIWGENYPGWAPIRDRFNHEETRFLYWMSYDIDVHYPSQGVERKRKCCWVPHTKAPTPGTLARFSTTEKWLYSSYDAKARAKEELESPESPPQQDRGETPPPSSTANTTDLLPAGEEW